MENKPQSHAEFAREYFDGLGISPQRAEEYAQDMAPRLARHVESHAVPVTVRDGHVDKAIAILNQIDGFKDSEKVIHLAAHLAKYAASLTAPEPQAVSRTAEEVGKRIVSELWDEDEVTALPRIVHIIQTALDAARDEQHKLTWVLATEAAAQSLKDKIFYDRDLEIVEGKMQRDCRALPCPPLEQEGV